MKQIFKYLSNTLYNVSQNPEDHTVDQLLDIIKENCQRYEKITGEDLMLVDHRN